MIWIEMAVVLVLMVANGYLAASELAVVSSRKPRLQRLANASVPGAAAALSLGKDSGRFLSTVQIGITLIGILAGAFSGATIAERFADYLETFSLSPAVAEAAAVILVVAVVTYLSLIVGELIPKQIALRNPERIAARVARSMTLLSRIASPVVTLLDASSRLGLRLMGAREASKQTVTNEEISTLVAEAESAGVVETAERNMITGVMRLADRSVQGIMTPRRDVDWIDLDDSDDEIHARIRTSHHSRLPVGRGGIDSVLGIIEAKDMLYACIDKGRIRARDHVKLAPVVPDSAGALEVLATLKASPIHMALVVDEYGVFEGVVTTADILEAIAGGFVGDAEGEVPRALRRDDGSWLFDGALPVDQMADVLAITLPGERSFHTVAGFLLQHLPRLPTAGESLVTDGWRFEIVDMDGRRIDKVLATRATTD
ncbi:MAG: HlyC/CorC family transporter [Alphaproteobacteria bacterium]|nr:HlyC/CorC family transporter [Alphaproteobacteria bacterium]